MEKDKKIIMKYNLKQWVLVNTAHLTVSYEPGCTEIEWYRTLNRLSCGLKKGTTRALQRNLQIFQKTLHLR